VDALNGKAQGLSTHWHRSILLVLAITLHNIPEGLAVGVSFGAAGAGVKAATFAGAVSLAIGIGLQNFPEGASVSVPLRREGLSRLRSFWYGQLSGVVEPIAGVAGAYAVLHVRPMLPYALSFRGRRHDFRGHRRTHSRIEAGPRLRHGHHRRHLRLCHHDAAGRCAGVGFHNGGFTQRRKEAQRAQRIVLIPLRSLRASFAPLRETLSP
jgi:hypothetical protein